MTPSLLGLLHLCHIAEHQYQQPGKGRLVQWMKWYGRAGVPCGLTGALYNGCMPSDFPCHCFLAGGPQKVCCHKILYNWKNFLVTSSKFPDYFLL